MITVEPEVYLRIMRGAIVHEVGPFLMSELEKLWEHGQLQGRITHYWYRPMENWAPFDPTRQLPRTIDTSFENPFIVVGSYETKRQCFMIGVAFAAGSSRAGEITEFAHERAMERLAVRLNEIRADGLDNLTMSVCSNADGYTTVSLMGNALCLGPPVFSDSDLQGPYR